MQRSESAWIDFDLEKYPLEIKTNSELSELGSEDFHLIHVSFKDSNGREAGEVTISFESTPQYYLHYCSTSLINLPTTLPTATDKLWTITLTRTSGIRLQIHCNNVEMVDILISESTCRTSRYNWRTYWTRDVAKMKFSSSDKASDYYRAKQGNCWHEPPS